jgi:crossover junction endodeoxyribonuclease RuvC
MGISTRQFEELRRRMAGGGGDAGPVLPGKDVPVASAVLGVDPSLRGTGWGVVRLQDGRMRAVGHGTIRCPASWQRSRCLGHIHETLRDVLREHAPEVCAVEGLFHAQNLRTALIMGEARGAALAAVALAGLQVFEMAPRKVKLAVAGHGGAAKAGVGRMVQRLLGIDDAPEPDAADALAVAIAYMQEAGRLSTNPPRKV